MTTAFDLPTPIAHYFANEPHDAAEWVACFAANAVVTDEGQAHAGTGAIKAWKTASSARYEYTSVPISLVQRHLRIGYNRAARLLEQMEKSGVVSTMQSNGNRDILVPTSNAGKDE